MKSVSHEEQKEKWNKEHAEPFALKQMDGKPSSQLIPFIEFLQAKNLDSLVGLEMGCGKGRSSIGLVGEAIVSRMYGFDFSEVAIAEAKKRAGEAGVGEKTTFDVMDATQLWKYESDFFDFGVDWTASTDIEDLKGRQFAVNEMHRVLKPGGYFMVYVMSTDDEYHKMMVEKSPGSEPNSFIHPDTGKYEKIFSEAELDEMYKAFKLIEARRIEKTTEFFGKSYYCKNHWRIYQK